MPPMDVCSAGSSWEHQPHQRERRRRLLDSGVGTGGRVTTRATSLLVEWGFHEMQLDQIELLADVDNVASRRIARKLGFVEEGVLRSHLNTRRGRRDSVVHGRLRSDPAGEPAAPRPPARSRVDAGLVLQRPRRALIVPRADP